MTLAIGKMERTEGIIHYPFYSYPFFSPFLQVQADTEGKLADIN